MQTDHFTTHTSHQSYQHSFATLARTRLESPWTLPASDWDLAEHPSWSEPDYMLSAGLRRWSLFPGLPPEKWSSLKYGFLNLWSAWERWSNLNISFWRCPNLFFAQKALSAKHILSVFYIANTHMRTTNFIVDHLAFDSRQRISMM